MTKCAFVLIGIVLRTQRPPASSTDSLCTEITCSATYWNFRRFETCVRVVNPR